MIFKLPDKCKVDKNIPKEIIYKNADADEKFKRIFIENVEKIRYEYALTNDNTNIEKYIKENERYEEVHFIRIALRKKGKENTIAKLLHQLIPKGTVLKLEFNGEILLSIANKKINGNRISIEEIYNTNWLNKDNENLNKFNYENLNSTNMKTLYESLIEKIRIINLGQFSDDIKKGNLDLIEKLNKEIEELKILRKKETQTNRVVEIQSKLLEKIKERNNLKK